MKINIFIGPYRNPNICLFKKNTYVWQLIFLFLIIGARVDSKDNSGKTPLLLALENGKFNIAEYLIKHGSDVNEVDHLGQSSLFFVANADCSGSSKIVKTLICCGYVLKDCDSWLCPDNFTGNKTKESKYRNLIHKLKLSFKTMSNSKNMIL